MGASTIGGRLVRATRSTDMTGTPAAPAWYTDPTGRHQHRYWDGGQWTAWVADNGTQGQDPLAPAAPAAAASAGNGHGDLESIAGRARLRVEMVGGKGTAGWRAVRDDAGNDVARLQCERGVSRLCDLSGAAALTVTAAMRHRSEREIYGLSVAGANGELAAVSYTRARSTTLKCNHAGARVLTIKFNEKMSGRLENIVLLDGAERQVGAIEEVGREARGLSVTSWLVLDRDPSLADPVRTLAVAAPVMIDCFVNGALRG